MTSAPTRSTVAAPLVLGAARVALGVLWFREGSFKYRAGFGGGDIRLVADSAASNTRVPDWFTPFADDVLGRWPSAFGVAIPLLEVALGVALVIGVLTFPAAAVSLITLTTYWSADQLIEAYPVMILLSGVLVAWPEAAGRWSVPALVSSGASRRRPRGWSR